MLKKVLSLSTLVVALHLSSSEPMIQSSANVPGILAQRLDFTNTPPLTPDERLAIKNNDTYNNLIDELLSEAHSHLGTGYRRGGKSPKAFDCSGFTGYVYNKLGYNLGASSREQYSRDGFSVPDNEILPGDLLFFRGRRSKSVGHVGIAIEADPVTGDITFIHAAVKGGIRIDHTKSPYYRQRYIGARRIISNNI